MLLKPQSLVSIIINSTFNSYLSQCVIYILITINVINSLGKFNIRTRYRNSPILTLKTDQLNITQYTSANSTINETLIDEVTDLYVNKTIEYTKDFMYNYFLDIWYDDLNSQVTLWNENAKNALNIQLNNYQLLQQYNNTIVSYLLNSNQLINATIDTLLANKYILSTEDNDSDIENLTQNLILNTSYITDMFDNVTDSMDAINLLLPSIKIKVPSKNIRSDFHLNILNSGIVNNFTIEAKNILTSTYQNFSFNDFNTELNFTVLDDDEMTLSYNDEVENTIFNIFSNKKVKLFNLLLIIFLFIFTAEGILINYYLYKCEKKLFNETFSCIINEKDEVNKINEYNDERKTVISLIDTSKSIGPYLLTLIELKIFPKLDKLNFILANFNRSLIKNNKIWITFFTSIVLIEICNHSIHYNTVDHYASIDNDSHDSNSKENFIQTTFNTSTNFINETYGNNFTHNTTINTTDLTEYKLLSDLSKEFLKSLNNELTVEVNNHLFNENNGILTNTLQNITSEILIHNNQLQQYQLSTMNSLNFTSLTKNISIPLISNSYIELSTLLVKSSINTDVHDSISVIKKENTHTVNIRNKEYNSTNFSDTGIYKHNNGQTSLRITIILPIFFVALIYILTYNLSLYFT